MDESHLSKPESTNLRMRDVSHGKDDKIKYFVRLRAVILLCLFIPLMIHQVI